MKASIKPAKGILYIAGMVLLFTLIGLLGLLSPLAIQGWYLLAQLLVFGLGVVHLFLLYRFFSAPETNQDLYGLGLTCIVQILGGIGIWLLYLLVFKSANAGFATCIIPFVIPYLFAWAYRAYRAIPDAEYKKWFYPLGGAMPDLDLIDLSKILVVQFEFPKRATDAATTNFKAKAPLQMRLGELFLIFLNDYNEQNGVNGIQFTDPQNRPYGWHFYAVRGRFLPRRYFDPDLTFLQNNIQDNFIIKAERNTI